MALTNFARAVAVITGAASGIGLATARDLHSRGAHVVLADINTPALQAVTKDIRDLTMAPNPDIALALQLYSEDPDKAEIMAGEAYHRRLKRLAEQEAAQRSQQ